MTTSGPMKERPGGPALLGFAGALVGGSILGKHVLSLPLFQAATIAPALLEIKHRPTGKGIVSPIS